MDAAIAGQSSNGSKKVPQTRSTLSNGAPNGSVPNGVPNVAPNGLPNGHTESSTRAAQGSPSASPLIHSSHKRKRYDESDSGSPIGSPSSTNRPLKNKTAAMKPKFTTMKTNEFYGNSKNDAPRQELTTTNDVWEGKWSPSKKKADQQQHHTFRPSGKHGKSRPNASPYSFSSRAKGGGGHGGSRQNQRKSRF